MVRLWPRRIREFDASSSRQHGNKGADPEIWFRGHLQCPFPGAKGVESETLKASREWGME